MALIELKNAALGYDTGVVVRGLNFAIRQGDFLCIVGENGSGKSTLMKGLLGLLHPVQGSIARTSLKASEIGYLPQQTAAQKDFPASVYEVVLSGRTAHLGLRPFFSKQDHALAQRHLDALGILGLKKRCYRELSGGQQQRVLLARALCASEKLLLLDEPVAGLDPVATQDFYDSIRGINQKSGIAVVMVSHDILSALGVAKKVLHLGTEQLFYGSTEEYLRSEIGHAYAHAAGKGGHCA